jgi:pimeloyl-ACP methyl ester carboxylesterase
MEPLLGEKKCATQPPEKLASPPPTRTGSAAAGRPCQIILTPFIAVILLGWVVLGRLMSLQTLAPPWLLLTFGWMGVLSLYVGLISATCGLLPTLQYETEQGYLGFDSSLLDVLVVLTAAMPAVGLAGGWAARSTLLRRLPAAWASLSALLLLHTVFVTAKGIALAQHSGHCRPDSGATTLLLAAAGTCVVLSGIWYSRIWRPATAERLAAAERMLLELRTGGRPFRQSIIAGLGTVEAGPADGAADAGVIVMVHGFASGNGLWCENLAALSERHRLLCVEWKGVGRSHRPFFTPTTYPEAVDWFIPAFAQWRETMGLTKPFTLVGHSMGAMLATEWALRHPGTVRKLVLASPAGVPEPKPGFVWSGKFRGSKVAGAVLGWLWKRRITPVFLVRQLGPLGPYAVRKALVRRLNEVPEVSPSREALNEPFLTLLTEYMYNNLAGRGSGEKALVTMMRPGFFAVEPLAPKLMRPECPPFAFIYGGDYDWMWHGHAALVIAARRERGLAAPSLTILEAAGHHVMVDDASGFNAAVLKHAT